MPGHAGGGHSGGFSGGGHSGGGHSGSFGGGHSGSFSSGSHSSSGRSTGMPISFRRMGSGFRRSGGSGGCSGLAVLLIFAPIILIAAVAMLGDNVFSYFSGGDNGYSYVEDYVPVSEKLEGKSPLAPELCTRVDKWMESDIDGYLSDEDETEITDALEYFYTRTGVQPYFILTGSVNGSNYPDEYEIDDYLYNKYIDIFGEDEGHYILLMVFDTAENYYTTWYIPGLDAETVIDADGSDILLSYIDSNADEGMTLTKAVSTALRSTANDIIDGVIITRYEDHGKFVTDTKNRDFTKMFSSAIVLLILLGAGIAAAIVIYGRARKKKKSVTQESDYRSVDYTEVPKSGENGQYREYKDANRKPDTDFPVVCPNCGANAYLDSRGCCQYCGTKIK